MKKITILILIIITIIAGFKIVNAGNKTEYYQQYGYYYSTGSGGSIFVPEGCGEKDVKIATQASNRVRFWVDGNSVTKTLNLTEDGNNSWGNVDPTGCWHTFQKIIEDQSYIWVGSTSNTTSWPITKGLHPDWNQVSGEIIFSNNGELFTINMFGKNLKSLGLSGDYPKFFPNGRWLVFQRENKIFFYNGVETEIGEGKFAIPFPDNLGVYIIKNHEIIATSLSGKQTSKTRGENIAPDPRKGSKYNITEIEGKLVIFQKTILDGKEPTWWVHISLR